MLMMREEALMSFKEVQAEVRLSDTTILKLRKAGKFPEPIKIGLRKIAWHRSDIEAWKKEGVK